MSIYGDKKRSLLEQKKLQWAKEREEISQLSIPWGKTYTKFDKNSVRGKALSKFSNSELSLNREEHYSNRNLPPISRNKSYDHYEVEGDTSGYASDAKEGSPEYYVNPQRRENPSWSNWHHRSSESDVSVSRDDRLKWGDRGLGVAHLWEPHELDEHISKTVEREPPGWMQRGLQSDNKEVLVVNSNSPETGESSSTDRPYTGESTNTNMHSLRTHLRGQNIPLEPTEAAERERKRQKAIELQNAIKQQLEEREMQRKQDREKKLREEAEEESRIRREQEIERLRVEEEHKMMNEKKERERKRNEVMQEALENAEKAAKLEKSKQKHMRMKSNILNLPEDEPEWVKKDVRKQSASPNNMMLVPSPRNSHQSPVPERISPVNNIIPMPYHQESNIIVPENIRDTRTVEEEIQYNTRDKADNHLKVQDNLNSDNLTLVLQNPFDSLQGMQLALLVPTATMNVPNTLPVAVPIPVGNEPSVITENRILTPSVYRMKKNCRETSTQTDSAYFRDRDRPESSTKEESYRKEDNYGSLDRRRNSNASDRKERRMRSEERSKEPRTEKPKWGANKPPMRYLKQSEKDPAYQKRKMRQKTREIIYEDKNNNYSQSSDDSIPQTPDHRLYRKPGYNRNMWHKNERMFSQNISVYQTEIVPLELDRQGRLYVKDRTDYREERVTTKQKYRDSTPDSSRRLERITPRSETRKERLNERNERKRLEREESYDRDDHPSEGLLVKLDNLRHGLLLKQKQWDDDNSSVRTNKSAIEFPNVHDNP